MNNQKDRKVFSGLFDFKIEEDKSFFELVQWSDVLGLIILSHKI